MTEFANLKASALRLAAAGSDTYTETESINLFCRDCQFFREDDQTLECSALAVLRRLLHKKIISLEDVIRAVSD